MIQQTRKKLHSAEEQNRLKTLHTSAAFKTSAVIDTKENTQAEKNAHEINERLLKHNPSSPWLNKTPCVDKINCLRFLFFRWSKDVIVGHLERRHGLVDVLVEPVILHPAWAEAVPPAATLSQQHQLHKRKDTEKRVNNDDIMTWSFNAECVGKIYSLICISSPWFYILLDLNWCCRDIEISNFTIQYFFRKSIFDTIFWYHMRENTITTSA